jgi:hypothetical protein
MGSPRDTPKGVGCPIRTSRDRRMLASPPGFSQRATSFIASRRQGIHRMPFVHSTRPGTKSAGQGAVVRGQWSETTHTRQRPRARQIPGRYQAYPCHRRPHGAADLSTHRGRARSHNPSSRCQTTPHRRHAPHRAAPRRRALSPDPAPGQGRQPAPPPHPAGSPPGAGKGLVGLGRFERPTSRLSGVRSDRLSYRPGDQSSGDSGRGSEEPRHARVVSRPSDP